MGLTDKFFTKEGEYSLEYFYTELYKKRIKLGYACVGIKKRMKQLGIKKV